MPAAWPHADQHLERAYRRLLLAYPGHYRRRHGTEIVTTLLEMAGPGQRRPARADAWHLLASGLRQRFRLPAGRPLAWVAAILITLIVGALGAAAGSWAGVRTFAALPDRAALAERVTGTGGGTGSAHDSSPWSHTSSHTRTEVPAAWQLEPALQRLRADGWQVSAVTPLEGSAATLDPATGATIELPTNDKQFRATLDGAEISVQVHFIDIARLGARHAALINHGGTVSISTWAATTPAFLPLIVAGTMAGLIAGWLIAAAGAYRIQRARRPRPAAVTCALAVLAAALPAVALYGNLMRAFRARGDFGPAMTVHSAFNPGDYYPFGPPWQILALSIAGAVLAAATFVISRPGPATTPEPSPAAG